MAYRYRQCRNGYLNCNVRMYDGVGRYEVPEVAGADIDISGCSLIGFDRALSCKKPENKIVHFFMDDYKFETIWLRPQRYIEKLSQFRAVIGPDFSKYTDFPKAARIFNHYRNQWTARYWQEAGVKIIPNIQFGFDDDRESFDFCLDGVPTRSTVCISAIGAMRTNAGIEDWLEAYHIVAKELQPKRIIVVGAKYMPELEYGGEVVVMLTDNIAKKRLICRKGETSVQGI